jgi:hypothetical protein
MNIGDLIYAFPNTNTGYHDTEFLKNMLKKIGKEETIKRISWLYGESDEKLIENLIDSYLSGDYVDDYGEKGGTYFYGDL